MNILITGTSRGIGKEAANKFLQSGHDVFGIDLPGRPNPFPKEFGYTHIEADVTHRETLPDLLAMQVVVNCAGVQTADPDEYSQRDMDVNFWGVVNITRKYALQPDIKAIVNVASASAHTGAEFPVYAASKGALLTYTKHIAQEVAKWGATCNSISPGAVITDLNEHILKDAKLFEAVANESLLKRWATPEEIAEWIYFIAVINRSMTAQDVLIDNGEMAKCNFIW